MRRFWRDGPLVALAVALVSGPVFGETYGGARKVPTDAMFAKCSDEANAKGLYVSAGKGAERKAFRVRCVRGLMEQAR